MATQANSRVGVITVTRLFFLVRIKGVYTVTDCYPWTVTPDSYPWTVTPGQLPPDSYPGQLPRTVTPGQLPPHLIHSYLENIQ